MGGETSHMSAAGGGDGVNASGGSSTTGGSQGDTGGAVPEIEPEPIFTCTPIELSCDESVLDAEICSSDAQVPEIELRFGQLESQPCGEATCSLEIENVKQAACPIPVCVGTVTACSSRSSNACTNGEGCRNVSDCKGTAKRCSSITYSLTCEDQFGCDWNYNTHRCTGTADRCSDFGSYYCNRQDGCSWETDCTGAALSCENATVEQCESQPGCSVEYVPVESNP